MERSVFLLVLTSVLMSAFAQIALKSGMSTPAVAAASAEGINLVMLRAVATSPYVLLGLFLYFASAAVWLLVLAKVDVGLAYPFVGLGFVVTVLLAWGLRGEEPTVGRIAGALIICLGVVVLARS
jgi:multidrug transporter EmrE-like cation transporter